MTKVYRDSTGTKLYPVCAWEPNQHKLHNACDRAYIRMIDEEYSDAAVDEYERVSALLEAFDQHVINGLVYAPYHIGQQIKDIVAAYNVRTDQLKYGGR